MYCKTSTCCRKTDRIDCFSHLYFIKAKSKLKMQEAFLNICLNADVIRITVTAMPPPPLLEAIWGRGGMKKCPPPHPYSFVPAVPCGGGELRGGGGG